MSYLPVAANLYTCIKYIVHIYLYIYEQIIDILYIYNTNRRCNHLLNHISC